MSFGSCRPDVEVVYLTHLVGNQSLAPHVNWRWDVDYTAPLAGLPQVIVPSKMGKRLPPPLLVCVRR